MRRRQHSKRTQVLSVDSGTTSTQAKITVKPDDATKAKVTGDFTTQKIEFSIALVSKDAPNTSIGTKQVLYGTGNVAAAPAPPKNAKVPAKGGKASPK